MDKDELKAKLLKKAAVERKYKAEIGRSLLRGYKAKREEAASKIKAAIKRSTEQSFYNNFMDKYKPKPAPAISYDAVIRAAAKRTMQPQLSDYKSAAEILQAGVKRQQAQPLYNRLADATRENIKNEIVPKTSTGAKNVYPQEPIYDREKLKDMAREIMKEDPSVKIRLNATNSELINFVSANGYSMAAGVKEFKPTMKRGVGRPKKLKM